MATLARAALALLALPGLAFAQTVPPPAMPRPPPSPNPPPYNTPPGMGEGIVGGNSCPVWRAAHPRICPNF